jgi:hypothetical protein
VADQKHLHRLQKDVCTWNEWRKDHPAIMVDLSGAHLSETYLLGASLDGADLSGAHLDGVDLNVADLSEANLKQAHLIEAHLINAQMRGANLNQALLSKTDLSGANLNRASLRGRSSLKHASSEQTLARPTEALIQETIDAVSRRQDLKLDANGFAIYTALEATSPAVTPAQAQVINGLFWQHPDCRWDGQQESALRAELYKVLRPIVGAGQMVAATDALLRLERV